MNIYVGNLAYKMSEEELRAAFEAYGTVDSARFVIDRETGRSKGFGFVEMPVKEEAMAAIEGLNGTELNGRTVTVNEATSTMTAPSALTAAATAMSGQITIARPSSNATMLRMMPYVGLKRLEIFIVQ